MKYLFITFLFLLEPTTAKSENCSLDPVLQKIFLPDSNPVDLEVISLNPMRMDKQLIKDVRNGKRFSYWVDSQDQMFFSDPRKFTEPNSFLMAKDASSKDAFIIKEAGNFSFDPATKKYIFEQKKSWDLKPDEINDAIREQTKLDFTRNADPRFEKGKVVSCTEVMSAQQRAENFLMDSVVSSAVVTVGSFVTVEAISPGNKTLKEKAKLLTSDLIANSISSVISSFVVKPLILKNAGIITDFTQRTATDFGTNLLVKKPTNWYQNR